MYEYKWSVGIRHKITREKLNLTVWAPTNDEATHKLCGVLIGPECDYEWTGTGPVYENNKTVEREARPAIYKEDKYMKTPVSAIAPGKVISYRGELCIVLEHRQDGTLLMDTELVKRSFGDTNNFADSSLRSHLNGVYLDDLTQGHPDVETHFDPDAVSPTHDYGLMQINQCNHEWLRGLGMDPLTHAGNIEAGVYIIGNYLDRYGDTEQALMAYNNGPTGARKLWDAGVYQTDYTRKVMTALEHWTSILED